MAALREALQVVGDTAARAGALAYFQVGEIYRGEGDMAAALGEYQKAQAVLRETQDDPGQAAILSASAAPRLRCTMRRQPPAHSPKRATACASSGSQPGRQRWRRRSPPSTPDARGLMLDAEDGNQVAPERPASSV